MKKILFIVLNLLILNEYCEAQIFQKPPKTNHSDFTHSVYLELGGSTITASLNYELQNTSGYSFRLGISPFVLLLSEFNEDYNENDDLRKEADFVAIIGVSKVFGTGSNHFETGAGFVFGQSYRDENDFAPLASGFAPYIGYRAEISSYKKSYLFRLTFTPIVNSEGIRPWAGLSFGYSL